jgi:hypothetical protein
MRPTVLMAVVLMLVGACAGPDPRSRSFVVSGTVTFNGQPVPDGAIILVSADPSLAADAGTITNGEYRFLASAGKKTVQIRASREKPYRGPPGVPYNPVYEEYIPAKFNEKSDRTIDVLPEATNRFDFALVAN